MIQIDSGIDVTTGDLLVVCYDADTMVQGQDAIPRDRLYELSSQEFMTMYNSVVNKLLRDMAQYQKEKQMFHIRTPESNSANPVSYCGELGVTDDEQNVTRFNMTDWEWVANVAHGHPAICQKCVSKHDSIKNTPRAIDDDGQPF
jgi:hypothetical protein